MSPKWQQRLPIQLRHQKNISENLFEIIMYVSQEGHSTCQQMLMCRILLHYHISNLSLSLEQSLGPEHCRLFYLPIVSLKLSVYEITLKHDSACCLLYRNAGNGFSPYIILATADLLIRFWSIVPRKLFDQSIFKGAIDTRLRHLAEQTALPKRTDLLLVIGEQQQLTFVHAPLTIGRRALTSK